MHTRSQFLVARPGETEDQVAADAANDFKELSRGQANPEGRLRLCVDLKGREMNAENIALESEQEPLRRHGAGFGEKHPCRLLYRLSRFASNDRVLSSHARRAEDFRWRRSRRDLQHLSAESNKATPIRPYAIDRPQKRDDFADSVGRNS